MSTLVDLKTYFLLGKYQSVVDLGPRLKLHNAAEEVERDLYFYRAFIEQGSYQIVLDEIQPDTSEPPLKAVRILAQLCIGDIDRSQVLEQLEAWLKDAQFLEDQMLLLMASFVYFRLGNIQKAFQCVRGNQLLEARVFVIHILLHIRRHDLALKELQELQKSHRQALPVQLATAWTYTVLGQFDQLDEAIRIYVQILEKYTDAFIAFYGIGLCRLRKKEYEQSETNLLLALERNPNSTETIINLIVLNRNLGKSEESHRYLSQLKKVDPRCSFLELGDKLAAQFDEASSSFKQTVSGHEKLA
ncbi:coatomer subunit epsilon-like [Schistocerca gregaria]|uniref:coatomer subunit epsilon-like n=1 Tax=Schistocerca gregaria TaxID=7010 RepID=UPI00211DA7DC|nr:coatomer subunit epsilon-like [Schistocerca gregaria]